MTHNNSNWFDFNNAPDQPPVSSFHDLQAVRNGLLAQLERLLQSLFPQGSSRHGKFFIGNLAGEGGKSLVVELQGDKRGFWKDFATEEGGDVFALCAGSQQFPSLQEFPKLLTELQQWLGSSSTALLPPYLPPQEIALDPRGSPRQQWHYLSEQGELIACVYRYNTPQGKQFYPWDVQARKYQTPTPRPLYNLPGIKQATQVVLVEGEQCAEALIQIGITATTAMNGAPAPIAKTDWMPLAGKNVLIWPDNDPPGQAYAQRAGQAILAAQASSVAILTLPQDKPAGWDAVDAIAEGFAIETFLASAQPIPVTSLTSTPETAIVMSSIDWKTENGLAALLTDRYREDWLYCQPWKKWLFWNGSRWQIDTALHIFHLARGLCGEAALKSDKASLKNRLSSYSTIAAVVKIASSDPQHVATADDWDLDIWAFNTPGGVIDLRSGERQLADRNRRITKIATATPQGDCPTWKAFLQTITNDHLELMDYLQRLAGYCLTGSTQEHALFFLYGTGANGKSVWMNVLTTILGDYAVSAPLDSFIKTQHEQHPTALAGLKGARLVCCVETEESHAWNESRIKAITGGDKISARFMHQDFFEYVPQFKLMMSGNHKPMIANTDHALQRRLQLIPFLVTITPEKQDKQLIEKLLKEREGILAWAVLGCQLWQREGLDPPNCVTSATSEYFEIEDAFGQWLEENCRLAPEYCEKIADLFADWRQWAERSGEWMGSVRRLSKQLMARKFVRTRLTGGARAFLGIQLKNPLSFFKPSDP